MATVHPCLWFTTEAEQAADFYISVFGGEIRNVSRYDENFPDLAGQVLTVDFRIADQDLTALNGGSVDFAFSEAVSLAVTTADQAETDRVWDALTSDGGEEGQCGWCKDRFGFSWQVVPTRFNELMASGDADGVQRMVAAMMQMRKMDIATLEAAFQDTDGSTHQS